VHAKDLISCFVFPKEKKNYEEKMKKGEPEVKIEK